MAKQKISEEEKEELRKEKIWWSRFISRMKEKGALISVETAATLRDQKKQPELFT